MRRGILLWAALFCGVLASAQAGTTSSAGPATSVTAQTPVSTTNPDNARYEKDPKLLAACEAQISSFAGQPCDIIFIGDSLTAGWLATGKAVWEKTFASKHALDFGVPGDQTQNVLWRLGNMDIQSLKPKVSVLLIGPENVANNAHEIADGIKAVIANTQEAFPGVTTILVSLPPNALTADKMARVNTLIRAYADDSTVYYLDLASRMTPTTVTTADGSVSGWTGLAADQFHFSEEGYQIWADALTPLLDKIGAK